MAITQCMTTSFKVDILKGDQDLLVDTLNIALYTSAANLDATTTAYTTSGEVSGAGYTAGGNVLTGTTVSSSGTTAFVSFTNSAWASATFTARGALIYNSSQSNKSIAVLDFGTDQAVSSGTFTIQFPTANATSAIIRIA
jgi:hypothetical protein